MLALPPGPLRMSERRGVLLGEASQVTTGESESKVRRDSIGDDGRVYHEANDPAGMFGKGSARMEAGGRRHGE